MDRVHVLIIHTERAHLSARNIAKEETHFFEKIRRMKTPNERSLYLSYIRSV